MHNLDIQTQIQRKIVKDLQKKQKEFIIKVIKKNIPGINIDTEDDLIEAIKRYKIAYSPGEIKTSYEGNKVVVTCPIRVFIDGKEVFA